MGVGKQSDEKLEAGLSVPQAISGPLSISMAGLGPFVGPDTQADRRETTVEVDLPSFLVVDEPDQIDNDVPAKSVPEYTKFAFTRGPTAPPVSDEGDAIEVPAFLMVDVASAPESPAPSEAPIRRRLRAAWPDDLYAVLSFARAPNANAAPDTSLPRDISRLIQIVIGSPDIVREAVRLTGKDPSYLRAAIIFYFESVLWSEPRDPYRELGITEETPRPQMIQNVRSLMEWLSPHIGGAEPEARFADRVLGAWQTVKNDGQQSANDPSLIEQRTVRGFLKVFLRSNRPSFPHPIATASRGRRKVAVAAVVVVLVAITIAGERAAFQRDDLPAFARALSTTN